MDKSKVVVLRFRHLVSGPNEEEVEGLIAKRIKSNKKYVLESLFATSSPEFTMVFLHFSKP